MSSVTGPGNAAFRSLAEAPAAGAASAPSSGSGATAAPSNPALYQAFGATAFASSALGLRAALNAEDAALLLAQAAMAIDAATKEASNQRIESAASGRRAAPGQALGAIARADADLTGNQASRAAAAADLQAKETERTRLVGEAAVLQTSVTNLTAQIKTAADKDKPALVQALAAAQLALNAKLGAIATVETAITALDTQIATLDTAIAANQVALQAAGLALLSAFGQIAVQARDADDARIQDVAASVGLDQRFDDLSDTLQAFRQDEIARTETEARAADADQAAQVSRRVMQAALGLLAGIETVLDLLRRNEAAPSLNPREAALASGQRFQLAL